MTSNSVTLAQCDAGKHAMRIRCDDCPYCEIGRLMSERDEALEILAIALPGPRPWPTEGPKAKLRIYRNMAVDKGATKKDYCAIRNAHVRQVKMLRESALSADLVDALDWVIRRVEGLPEHWIAVDALPDETPAQLMWSLECRSPGEPWHGYYACYPTREKAEAAAARGMPLDSEWRVVTFRRLDPSPEETAEYCFSCGVLLGQGQAIVPHKPDCQHPLVVQTRVAEKTTDECPACKLPYSEHMPDAHTGLRCPEKAGGEPTPCKIALGSSGLPVAADWQETLAKQGYPYGFKYECPTCHEATLKPPAENGNGDV